MTLRDYQLGRQLEGHGYPFYALLQTCMRQADSRNRAALDAAFPDVARELQARYEAPGGLLPGDPGYAELQQARSEYLER